MVPNIHNFIYLLSFLTDYNLKGEAKWGFKKTHMQLKYYTNVVLGILHSFPSYKRKQQPRADEAAPVPKVPSRKRGAGFSEAGWENTLSGDLLI